MGSNALGANILKSEYLKRLSELCKKFHVVLILDEITTAIGRTGKYFAFQHYSKFTPDIICISKGLGVGYANIGAAIVNKRIIKDLPSTGNILGNTFNGHFIACAAALKVCDIIVENKLVDSNYKKGCYIKEKLQELKKYPIVKDIEGIGLWFSISFNDIDGTNYAAEINKRNFDSGILMLNSGSHDGRGYCSSHLSLAPTFLTSYEDIDKIIEVIDLSIHHLNKKEFG